MATKPLRSTKGLTEAQLMKNRTKAELIAGILNARRTIELERNRFARLVVLLRKHATARLRKIINLQ